MRQMAMTTNNNSPKESSSSSAAETAEILQQQRTNSRKQILYLHPGPPKTATLTLQTLLTKYEAKLNDHTIFLLGRKAMTNNGSKNGNDNEWSCNSPMQSNCVMFQQHVDKANHVVRNCTTIIREQLDEYYRAGADVILTDERIGDMFGIPEPKEEKDKQSKKYKRKLEKYQRAEHGLNQFFRHILRTNNNDWEIRVVVGYQPYFDLATAKYVHQYGHNRKMSDQRKNSKGDKSNTTIQCLLSPIGGRSHRSREEAMNIFLNFFLNILIYLIQITGCFPTKSGFNS